MSLIQKQQDLDFLVQRASEILEVPGKAVVLDGPMEQVLLRSATLEHRHGLIGKNPLFGLSGRRKGHNMLAGLECYRLDIDGYTVRFVKAFDQLSGDVRSPLQDFCVVPAQHFTRFYRFLRQKLRRQPPPKEPAPIMQEDVQSRLWDNSVGFLTRGHEVLKRYDVPQKRGILLMGEPGNGKTMACRWLYSHCRRMGLGWRLIRAEEYERARMEGMAQSVFSLDEPGIILFDDFDLGVRNRDEFGPTSHHSTFLGELDGVEARQGIVYLFTSNARLSELDPAFLRPGRIDQVIQFSKPNAELRRRLICELWHADIIAALDIETVVRETDGLSFAEVTELKKLLALHFLDSGEWDWQWAWKVFHGDARYTKKSEPKIGFARASQHNRIAQSLPKHLRNRLSTENEDPSP